MTPRRWWEAYRERLDFELEALRTIGVEPAVDEAAKTAGQIVIRFDHTVWGRSAQFTAVFPAAYPKFPFELYAPDLDLRHHQNRFAGNLCLLAQPAENWSLKDHVARFLLEQLPAVVAAGASTEAQEVEAIEEHQAEPVSIYYDYAKGSLVLVDSDWQLPAGASGSLRLRAERFEPFRAAVIEVRGGGAPALVSATSFEERFSTPLSGRWFRVEEPIIEATAGGLLQRLIAVHPDAARPQWTQVGDSEIDVIGLVFPEEVAWRQEGDGWLFVVRSRPSGSREIRRQARNRRPVARATTSALARAGRYGPSDLLARIPVLAPLRDRIASVIGLGGLGAPSAIEFARAGIGRLGLLDGDVLEAGNGVRWPLGLSSAGFTKAQAIRDLVMRDWPLTETRAANWRLGTAEIGSIQEADALSLVLDGTDLVFDASASPIVQRYLADLAAELGVPYITIWSTNGGWGGVVARIRPDAAACWFCLQHALNDHLIPHPPVDPAPFVQPAGCGSPTFTGTSFDLAPVSTAGVRLAVSTLAPNTYGQTDWDVAVLSLRDANGGLVMPTWTTHILDRHERCENHRA